MENHVSARAWAGDKIPTWSIRRCWYSGQTLGLALEKDSRRHYIRSRIRKTNVVSQYVRLALTLSGRMDNQGTRGWVCYARFGELDGCSVSPRRTNSPPNLPTMALHANAAVSSSYERNSSDSRTCPTDIIQRRMGRILLRCFSEGDLAKDVELR